MGKKIDIDDLIAHVMPLEKINTMPSTSMKERASAA